MGRRSMPLLALALLMLVVPSWCNMTTDLPGGGHVEVETGSRGEVCMYITDDWGTVETSQCTSQPGTYTLTGRGGGQARVTISDFGGVSVNTGYFGERSDEQEPHRPRGSSVSNANRRQQPSEDEENSVRFGSFENPRAVPPRSSYTEAPATEAPQASVASWLPFALRRRPNAPPTLPPVRVPHLPNRVRPTFGPLVLPQGPPVTEAGLGAVEILASGPGQLTVFGDGFDSDGDRLPTGPSAVYPPPRPLTARKKRNRFSAASSSDNEEGHEGGTFVAARASDGSSSLFSAQPGHRFSSVQSPDGSSVLNSQQGSGTLSSVHSADGSSVLTSRQGSGSVSSVQSADGSSVLTSQTPGGQRLGVVRSPDGSVVFSTFIDGRLVNVVQSSDGSSVVSANIDGRQVTALTSPTGQRLIAGAGPGHNLDAFFNRVMAQLSSLQ